MDRSSQRKNFQTLLVASLLGTWTGCVANPVAVPTVWDKLGITGATARLRDATINRRGNYPGLEKKPPVLKIADPANLAPEKPEVIKTAAKIKQDQDLKQQKIKAIKFLAEVGCGCYNKDDAVAKALLEALGDCDPDVKRAAIEAITRTSGECSQCRSGCETSCCSEEIVKKLQEMATGMDAKGCYKEPDPQIRAMAASAARNCPCPPARPIEEVPAPQEIEEAPAPESELLEIEPPSQPPPLEGVGAATSEAGKSAANIVTTVSFAGTEAQVRLDAKEAVAPPTSLKKNLQYGSGEEPVRMVKRRGKDGELIAGIANPDQLLTAIFVRTDKDTCRVELELPDLYQLSVGTNMVLVDAVGNHQVGRVESVQGRKVHVVLDTPSVLALGNRAMIRVGMLGQ